VDRKRLLVMAGTFVAVTCLLAAFTSVDWLVALVGLVVIVTTYLLLSARRSRPLAGRLMSERGGGERRRANPDA